MPWASRPSEKQKNATLDATTSSQPPSAASVIRRIVTVRRKGSASGFVHLSAFAPARTRQTIRQPIARMMPKGVSPASIPRISIVQYQPEMIPMKSARRRNTITASSSMSRCSIVGPNTWPASHTGSEQTNRITPCKSANRTTHRLHPWRCMRPFKTFGKSASRKLNIITAATPSAQCPAISSTQIACPTPSQRNSCATSVCHRSGNGAAGGRTPAATATSSHVPGGNHS